MPFETAAAPTFDEVVLGRRGIRGYRPDPVPKAVIREVIELAMRAPSSLNTQPWNFYVVAGEPLDRIRAGNTEPTWLASRTAASSAATAPTRAPTGTARSRSPSRSSAPWAPSGAVANAVVSNRKPVDEAAVFIGFDE